MEIRRHCRERLPGGERTWRRLARLAGYTGRLTVYGYGTGHRPIASSQRKMAHDGANHCVVGEYHPRFGIRVWMPAPCAIKIRVQDGPLLVFAHELAHYRLERENTAMGGQLEERVCDLMANRLIAESASG